MVRIGRVVIVSRAETGIKPGVDLLQAPNLESVGAAIANCNGAGWVLDVAERPAWVVPVVNKWAIGINPFGVGARIRAALRVAKVIFDQRIGCAGRAPLNNCAVDARARTTVNSLARDIRA